MTNETENTNWLVAADAPTINVDEAARIVGVSATTIRRAIKDGKINVRRFGSRVIIPRSEIERILSKGSVK